MQYCIALINEQLGLLVHFLCDLHSIQPYAICTPSLSLKKLSNIYCAGLEKFDVESKMVTELYDQQRLMLQH
jgi:hypothetical protein